MRKLLLIGCLLFAAPALAYRLTDRPATVALCGTSPSIIGTDDAGRVTVGTSTVTSCTINFSKTYMLAPACVASVNAILASSVTVSTSSIMVTTASTMASKVINYVCNYP